MQFLFQASVCPQEAVPHALVAHPVTHENSGCSWERRHLGGIRRDAGAPRNVIFEAESRMKAEKKRRLTLNINLRGFAIRSLYNKPIFGVHSPLGAGHWT
jgi:hypothetical protein